jgi:hypothetical protein
MNPANITTTVGWSLRRAEEKIMARDVPPTKISKTRLILRLLSTILSFEFLHGLFDEYERLKKRI